MIAWTRLALAGVVVLACVGTVHAAWRTSLGLDVSSGKESLLLIGDLDQRTTLYARCIDGQAELFLDSYDGGTHDIEPVGEVRLRVTTDAGGSVSSEATFGRVKSGYVTSTWLDGTKIGAAVSAIVAAKTAISISLEYVDTGDLSQWDTDAKGSTAAGKAFLAACPGAATPAVTTAAGAPAWGLTLAPDPVNGGTEATLIGDLDQGGYFYAYCDGRQQAMVAFLSNNPATFSYEEGDVGLSVQIEIDGEARTATGEYFRQNDGLQGIRYAVDPQYIEGLIAAIGMAKADVAMFIQSYSSGMVTRWPAKNLSGLAAAVSGFSGQCFGTPGTTTVAEPAVPAPAETGRPWEVEAKPEADGTTSYTLNGESVSGFGALFFACTSEGGIYTGFSTAARDLPGYAPGAPMQMTIAFGTFNYDFAAKVAAVNDTAVTVFSENAGMAGIAADALTYGVEQITVTLRDAARGSEYVRQIGTNDSAYAADDFLTRCEESAMGSAPAAAPLGSWEVLVGEAALSYAARAMMISSPAGDQSFAALACLGSGDDWAFFILAPDAPEPLFPASDHGYMLNLSIDDAEFSLWGGQPVAVAGFRGVAFRDTPAEVLTILGVLSIDPEAFSVELVHAVSGESLRRFDLPIANAGNAAAGAFAGCYS